MPEHAHGHHHEHGHGGPTDILRAEHDAIEHLLQAMDGMAAVLESGGEVPRRDVESALGVIAGFADKCHHAKEEKVLFPVLRRAAPAEGERIARALEGDHAAARKLTATMRAQAAAGESGRANERTELARQARTYAKLLRAHIALESKDLFELVEKLPPQTRHHLAEEFDRIEAQETGEGAHERFERDIHLLHARDGH